MDRWSRLNRTILLLLVSLVVVILLPPREYENRLAYIPPEETKIDNDQYDLPSISKQWWDPSGLLGGLHAMNPVRVQYFHRQIEAHFGKEKDISMVDLGCGGGILTEAMASLGYTITGIDISENSIEVAKQHLPSKYASQVTYLQGDIYAIPLANQSVSVVIISDVLEHLHHLDECMREINRILRPNGIILFDTINRNYYSYVATIVIAQNPFLPILPPKSHDYRLYITPEEIVQLGRQHHLEADISAFRGITMELHLSVLLREFGIWPNGASFTESKDLQLNYMGILGKGEDE